MNDDNDLVYEKLVRPVAPEMAAADPEMFAPLDIEENTVLHAHLRSGWEKQRVVYPTLSEPWKETSTVLSDLGDAWQTTFHAGHEPEAGQ